MLHPMLPHHVHLYSPQAPTASARSCDWPLLADASLGTVISCSPVPSIASTSQYLCQGHAQVPKQDSGNAHVRDMTGTQNEVEYVCSTDLARSSGAGRNRLLVRTATKTRSCTLPCLMVPSGFNSYHAPMPSMPCISTATTSKARHAQCAHCG
jgi:hypothetical protein